MQVLRGYNVSLQRTAPLPCAWRARSQQPTLHPLSQPLRCGLCRLNKPRPCRSNGVWRALSTDSDQQQQQQHDGFDLGMSVMLAGCAFEAYLEPEVRPRFREQSVNGTQTTYTDVQFVSRSLQGILQIILYRASNLPVADLNGSSDPYVVMTCGESCAQSSVVSRNLNPEWNTVHYLYVRDVHDAVRFRVFDKDTFTSDDDLGTAMASIADLQTGVLRDMELPLRGQGGGGTIRVGLRFLSFREESDVLQQAVASKERQAADSAPDVVKDAVDDSGGATQLSSAWKALSRVACARADQEFTPIAYVDNIDTDTQAWVYWNVDKREVVLAFRGTEQVKWKDFATDASLVPAEMNEERVTACASPLDWLLGARSPDTVQVHSGFLAAWDAVRVKVLQMLDAALACRDGRWTVFVTGHSLGGALATLCAYELVQRSKSKVRTHVVMYNYGSPRVGNQKFAAHYNELVPDSWRITNSNDIVPTVPRLLGYSHVRHAVQLSTDGGLKVKVDGVDLFGEGKMAAEVLSELVDKYKTTAAEDEAAAAAVFEEVLQHELDILSRLANGTALSEHMEDLYLASLRACVAAANAADESLANAAADDLAANA